MLLKSIKSQVVGALLVQFVLLVGIVSVTIYELNLRRHDYVILNLSGQLRVLGQLMVTQSLNYVEQAPRDYQTYERDLGLYKKDLMQQVASYDQIIKSFQARNLSPQLTSHANLSMPERPQPRVPSLLAEEETIYCSWDKQSRSQLDETAEVWQEFRQGLIAELGSDVDAPRLEAAAKYILFNEDRLQQASANLAIAFRAMMESKLDGIRTLNRISLLISFFIGITILFILYQKIFKAVDSTVLGFKRVAQGDLSYQVPVAGSNELGHLTKAFNNLTQRLNALFQLTDRINLATNLDEALEFVFAEFGSFLSLDWLGLVRANAANNTVYLERIFSSIENGLHERESFELTNTLFAEALASGRPVSKGQLENDIADYENDTFLKKLASQNVQSVILFPLKLGGEEQAILVFASLNENDYSLSHLEFLENIAAQISHGFDKTIGMESLVISAVEGLAKLAESRDPETGDHLYRMSMYSAIVAEELGKQGSYQQHITPAYVRDVLRFAPMHDIGKVGIEDSILLKPGKLDVVERLAMENHPVIGAQVLRRCEEQMNAVGHSIFSVGIEIAEAHHEKYNGEGYPYQLVGEAIPLSARIVAVADVFDALTSKRPYKDAWPIEKAMELMTEESGQHFDPEVVSALKRALPKILEVYEQRKHV